MTIPISTTAVLILNAGDGRRWSEYLGTPKQLATLGLEPVLRRTVRQLTMRGFAPISVTNDPRLCITGRFHHPSRHRCTSETLLSTQSMWQRRTIVLLGDVYFTETAITSVLRATEPLRAFARRGGNSITGRSHGEFFALCWAHIAAEQVKAAAMKAIMAYESGGDGNLWDLYHALVGLPYHSDQTDGSVFSSIDDLTDDIDTPETYECVRGYYDQHT